MNVDPSTLTPETVASVRSVEVAPDPPADFQQFWEETASELAALPLELETTPAKSDTSAFGNDVESAIWTATSLGGRRISGPLVRPKGVAGPLPQWVYGHGYGSIKAGVSWRPNVARQGFIMVGLDARGYGRSRLADDPAVPGWVLHEIESKSDYILRGAVADTIRAVDVARALEGADRKRTVLSGGSFSGGLGILAAPWIADLAYLAVSVPTFGAYGLRRTLVERGSGKEVNDFLQSLNPKEAAAIVENLRYFDAVNAAPFIETTTSVGLGVVDVVVPGETVAAIYHALGTADKELLDFPCSHSAHPLSEKWVAWDHHIEKRASELTKAVPVN